MTLGMYLLSLEEGEEVTVWDKDYDVEMYFYATRDASDSWDNSMIELSKMLKVQDVYDRGVVVNLSEVIENHIENLKKAKLFYDYDIDLIMEDIESIISGNVSEKWMEKFVNALKE